MSAKSLFLKQNVRIAAVKVVFPVKMRQGDFAVALGNKYNKKDCFSAKQSCKSIYFVYNSISILALICLPVR